MAKAITAPGETNFPSSSRVYRYDAGTATYSADLHAGTCDLFTDDFQVNDALYFAPSGDTTNFSRGLVFNIATAIAATSYTLVWEYMNRNTGAWTALPAGTYLDQTNQLTVLGVCRFLFRLPMDMDSTYTVNGLNAWWLRCRVSAVDTPTQGGAQGATIFKRVGMTFACSGSTTADPFYFDDFIAALVAEGYGTLFGQSHQNYASTSLDYRFWSVTFSAAADTDCLKCITRSCVNLYQAGWSMGVVLFGESSGRTYSGRYGPTIEHTGVDASPNAGLLPGRNDPAPGATCYNTRIIKRSGQLIEYSYNINMTGCIVEGSFYGGKNVTLNYCLTSDVNNYTGPASGAYTINGGYHGSLGSYSQPIVVRDAACNTFVVRGLNLDVTAYDCVYSSVTFTAIPAGGIFWQYNSVTVTVVDALTGAAIQGARVVILGDDGTTADLTSNAQGACTKTDFLYWKKERLVAGGYQETSTPYVTLTVTKPGYVTQVIKIKNDVPGRKQIIGLVRRRDQDWDRAA